MQAWQAPLIGAGLYVVGMTIDLTAFVALRPLKWWLRARITRNSDLAQLATAGSSNERLVYIQSKSPALGSEIAARSSRDRIARGTLINILLFTIFGHSAIPNLALILACLFSLGMWLRFEASSYTYELRAAKVLDFRPSSTATHSDSQAAPSR